MKKVRNGLGDTLIVRRGVRDCGGSMRKGGESVGEIALKGWEHSALGDVWEQKNVNGNKAERERPTRQGFF